MKKCFDSFIVRTNHSPFHFWSKSWYHLTTQLPQSLNSQGIAAFLLTPIQEEEYASVPVPNITKGVKLCQKGSKIMTMEGARFMVSIINLHTFIKPKTKAL